MVPVHPTRGVKVCWAAPGQGFTTLLGTRTAADAGDPQVANPRRRTKAGHTSLTPGLSLGDSNPIRQLGVNHVNLRRSFGDRLQGTVSGHQEATHQRHLNALGEPLVPHRAGLPRVDRP
jgi:hypothetical protein